MKIATQLAGALSSTAQDINRTEIDSLNGFIARRGAELRNDDPHSPRHLEDRTDGDGKRTIPFF